MRPRVSFFDQAADKLRQAMEGPAAGADRMRLIQEALMLYHRHQMEEIEDGEAGLGVLPPAAATGGEAIESA